MRTKAEMLKKSLIAGGIVLLLGGTSFAKHAVTVDGMTANGIMASRHNLASSGAFVHTANNIGDGALFWNAGWTTTETCVFCHTPHFTDKGMGPLWNRTSAGGSIESYGTTVAGNNDGASAMFSTLACLSCHDGVTTFDSLINRPGKGTGTGDQGWGFQMKNQNVVSTSYDHFVTTPGAPPVYCSSCHADGTLHPGEVERLVIGEQEGGKTNLTNDHPIGVLYRGAGDTGQSASLRARTTVISSIDMSVEQEDGSLLEPLVSGNLWAVKGFITNTATIQDLLKGSAGGAGNYVQCSSCHDPHYKNQTNPEADFYTSYGNDPNAPGGWPGQRVVTDHADFRIDGLFLRRVGGNSDSGVCRTCHNK